MKDINNICTSVSHELKKDSFPMSSEIVQTSSKR